MTERPDPTASRWARLTILKSRTPPDHQWALLYDSLVTAPVLDAHARGDQVSATIMDPVGILERLENAAREYGILDDEPPSPMGTYRALSVLFSQPGATGLELGQRVA